MSIIRMFSSEVIDNKIQSNNNDRSVATRSIWNQDKRICIPRINQQYVMDHHMYAKYLLMIQPPGSGKSMTIGFCMAQRLTENPNEKVIIAVPQTMISKSFGKTILRFPDDDVEWDISNNLCINTKKEKGVELRDFLRSTTFNDGINSRIVICTHITLASMTRELKIHPELLKNTTLIIDEAHHVLYPENGSRKSANRIGKLLKIQLKKEEPTFSLWLVTATFYRGDKGTVLPSQHINKFEKYFLPMDVHWKENIQYIKKFNLDFVIFNDNNPITEVKEILKLGKRKSIIYCPCTGKILQDYGTKYEFRETLMNAIYEVWPECNILDLIEENGREKQKSILENDDLAKDIDIILAVKLLDEGTDWKFAEQALNITPSESLRIENQRFGRLWRDVPGKEEIFYYVFLPKEANFKNEELRLHVSKTCTAFIATMLLEEIVEPIIYPKKTVGNESDSSNPEVKSNERPLTPIEEQIPDENKRQNVIAEVTKELMFLRNIEEDPTPKQVQDRIIKILDKHNVKEDQEDVAKHIIIMLRRRSDKLIQLRPSWEKQIKTVDVQWMVEAGFDKIWTNDIFDTLLTFTTGACDIKTFEQFRRIYGDYKTAEEWFKIAKEISDENNVIPRFSVLKESNNYGIIRAMELNPEMFKDFTIDSTYKDNLKTPDDWVKIAKDMENKNGHLPQLDQIPSGLRTVIYRYPEKFEDIKRYPYSTMTMDQWIEVGKQLQEENGGIMPTNRWLKENGYSMILYWKRNFPEKFEDLIFDDLDNLKKKHQKLANKLAKENGGRIPGMKWLEENGHHKLYKYIKDHPEDFKKDIILSRDERVYLNHSKIIEMIVDEDKIIPSYSEMKKLGYHKTDAYVRNNPERFPGYKRIVQGQIINVGENSLEKLQKITRKKAKDISDEFNGILPSKAELKTLKRFDIIKFMQSNSNAFKGLKQRVLNTRGKLKHIKIIGDDDVIPVT